MAMNPSLRPPLPVALTKAEALEYAARVLDDMAFGISMSEIAISGLSKLEHTVSTSLSGEIRALLDDTKKSLVDPKLQIAAAQAGARAIRELALEERIFAARASAGAGVS